jgi:iron complex outermembrane receptor protein
MKILIAFIVYVLIFSPVEGKIIEKGRLNGIKINAVGIANYAANLKLKSTLLRDKGEVKGKVTNAKGEGLPGVSILWGNSAGTATDVNGNFSLSLEEGAYTLIFSFIGYETQKKEITVLAGQSVSLNVQLQESTSTLTEVVVVGTRRPDRTVLETAVPVDVIDLKELATTAPQTDMTQILNYVAPSFNSTRQVTADGADHIDAASLRGLGPDQTLVLINGKRRHTTALINLLGNRGVGNVGTDLNTIPVNSIQRMEILRDGAAAQYGSDAIAGVMNIILKSDNKGGNILLNTGIHTAGDGLNTTLSINKGLKLTHKGFLNLTGDIDYRGYTIRDYSRDLNSWPVFDFTRQAEDSALAANGKTYKDYEQRNGNSKVLNTRIFYNAAIPFTEKSKFYSFGGFNYRKGEAAGLWRVPALSGDKIVDEIYPLGYQPLINTNVYDGSVAAGFVFGLGKWSLDVSHVLGANRMMYNISNTLNASMGPASPTKFDAGGFQFMQNVTNATLSRLFPDVLAGTNVAFGTEYRHDNYQIYAGEEASWKNYGQGKEDAPGGSQGFIGFSPESVVDGSRSNIGGFADVEADIVKNWTVSTALRFENYSDFGSAFIYKFTSRWQVVKPVALRAAYNTGFRAPSLQQILYRQLTVTPTAGGGTFSGIFNNKSEVARAAGIPELKAETSRNISAGLVLTPTSNLSVTADAYQIDIDDRIILSGLFGTGITDALDQALSTTNAEFAQFFTNSVNTRTRGLDVVANFSSNLGPGDLTISAAANFNKNTIRKINVPQGFESIQNDDNLGNNYVDQRQLSLLETGNPKSKINVSMGYAIGKLNFMLRNTYFGKVSYYDYNYDAWDFGSYYMVFSPKTVTDLTINYKPTLALGLTVGINNLFDIYPDTKKKAIRNGRPPAGFSSVEEFEQYFEKREEFPSYLPYDFDVIPYEPVQMGFNGRFVYLKAVYNFGI